MNPELHFFYCGNGDTILVRAGGDWGLIDCNLTEGSRAKERLLSVLDANAVKSLRFVCLTHYDRDHLNGMATILRERFSKELGDGSGRRRWFIGQIIQPLKAKDADGFLKSLGVMQCVVERIKTKKPPIEPVFSNQALEFIELTLQVLKDSRNLPQQERVYLPAYGVSQHLHPPPGAPDERALFGPFEVYFLAPEQEISDRFEYGKLSALCDNATEESLFDEVTNNAVSRVVALRHIDTGQAVLFAGDAPKMAWPDAISRWNQMRRMGLPSTGAPLSEKFHVVKVSHHGAENGHDPSLYSNWCLPRKTVAVISCRSNDSKHPHPVVLDELRTSRIQIEATGAGTHSPPFRRGAITGGRRVDDRQQAADIRIAFGDDGLVVKRIPI